MKNASPGGSEAIRFLLAHRALPVSAVLDGDVRVVTSRRERFAVHDIHHAGAVVCTVKTALETSVRPYLLAEGALLQYVQRHPRLSGIAPECHARDGQGVFLGMEHVAPVPSGAVRSFISATAAADLLASFHLHTAGAVLGLTATLPPIFGAVCLGRTANPGALSRLWSLAADGPALFEGVRCAARRWQRRSLIHSDVKPEHWLTRPRPDGDQPCLIDWELVRVGDPAWDAASVVHDYLREGSVTGDNVGPGVRLPQTAVAFLRRYREIADGRVWNREFPVRTALYAATRLVQTSLETLNVGGQWGVAESLRRAELIFRNADAVGDQLAAASGGAHAR